MSSLDNATISAVSARRDMMLEPDEVTAMLRLQARLRETEKALAKLAAALQMAQAQQAQVRDRLDTSREPPQPRTKAGRLAHPSRRTSRR